MPLPVVVGVDNGGTWIRLVGLDSTGRRVWTLKQPSPTVDKLPHFLRKILHRFNGQLDALAVGSRGTWKPSKRLAVKRAMRGLARKITVISDVEAAWLAAFGPDGQGIVVIAGTGSIAYGRKADGSFARAGGLGPEKGDEGSGYWIGKQWLLQTGQHEGLRKSVRDIASLAPGVLARARRGDPIAAGIIRSAQNELTPLVTALARKLHMKPTPVSWAGSILEDTRFRRGFFRRFAPHQVVKLPPKTDAATALARSIMCHAAG